MVRVLLVQGDLSEFCADAIVNAANDHLWMGSGVAGALKRRGGQIIEQEAVRSGPIPVGSAIATTAGSLHARCVIHGAVMGQDLRTDHDIVRKTTVSCLELALELGLSSIAFPALGCGVGGMTYKDTAGAMKEAIGSMDDDRLHTLDVSIVLYGGDAYRVFTRTFR
ncbi:MAG: macro domain-containing protein [Candidatus Thermoplasmatota archaeon]|nr:macro domain-containing protein [Candidatus Thermoplasmatota archaeon]